MRCIALLIFLACSCTKKDDTSESGVTAPKTTDAARALAPPSTLDAAVGPTDTARGPGEVDCAKAFPAAVITKHFGPDATLAYDPPTATTPMGYCRVTADQQTVLNANVSCGAPRWRGSIDAQMFYFEDHPKIYTRWPDGPGRAAWKNDVSDEQIEFIATSALCVVLLEFWAEVDRTALAKDVDARLTPEVASNNGWQAPLAPPESIRKVPVPAETACDDLAVMVDKIRRCEGGATLVDDLKPFLEDIQRWFDAGKPDDLRDSALGSCQALALQLSSFAKEFGCAISNER